MILALEPSHFEPPNARHVPALPATAMPTQAGAFSQKARTLAKLGVVAAAPVRVMLVPMLAASAESMAGYTAYAPSLTSNRMVLVAVAGSRAVRVIADAERRRKHCVCEPAVTL